MNLLTVTLTGLLAATAAAPQDHTAEGLSVSLGDHGTLTVGGTFQTVLNLRSDSDFDAEHRFYDPDGVTQSSLASRFRPSFGLTVAEDFTFGYELELDLLMWGGSVGGYGDGGRAGVIDVRQRELWARYRVDEHASLAFGHQHVTDPSGLFLDTHTTAVTVDLHHDVPHAHVDAQLVLGSFPHSSVDGIGVTGDNALTESFFIGGKTSVAWGGLTADFAGYFSGDYRLIDDPLLLGTVVGGVRWACPHSKYGWYAHAAGQFGSRAGSAADGGSEAVAAWALQGGIYDAGSRFKWSANFLALSPDDDFDGNGFHGAFFTGGHNRSATRWLTEDEGHDRHDNLDERLSTGWGPWFLNPAGIAIVDGSVGFQVADWYLPTLIVGAGVALNPDRALGETFVGVELDLLNRFDLGDHVTIWLNLQLFVPGGAAGAVVNDVNRHATDLAGGGQLGFDARF